MFKRSASSIEQTKISNTELQREDETKCQGSWISA